MLKLEGLPYNEKVSTIGTYRFHELKLQAVSGHTNKTRHYQLWDEVTFNSNRDPRWYSRRVKETLNRINRVFSHDVTAAILVSQNNETAAMLVSQINPVVVELFSYANAFFCSNRFAYMLAT